MRTVNDILLQLEDVANNPKKHVTAYIEENNSKAIGVWPAYTPEELVDAAGFLPVGLWGSNTVEYDKVKSYFPAFCASMIQTSFELALRGDFDVLSGVIVSCLTDTLKCVGQNWLYAKKDIPMIGLVYPQSRKIKAGVEFLESEFNNVKVALEKIKGSEIKEEDILNSIRIYNEHNAAMRKFDKLAASHPITINNIQRSVVFKSGWFMKKEEHTKIVNELNELLEAMDKEKFRGRKVVVTGIIFDDPNILQILEDFNIRIVGDYVEHESNQYRTDIPTEGDSALQMLAKWWSIHEGSSLAHDPYMLRGKMVGELGKKRKAHGAIFALLKFSDAEEYDMPIVCQDIDEAGFPVLTMEVDQESRSYEQIRTRVQTFAEMI